MAALCRAAHSYTNTRDTTRCRAATRPAALYECIWLRAWAERIGFLEAGREAVARGLVALANWDLLRDAHDQR